MVAAQVSPSTAFEVGERRRLFSVDQFILSGAYTPFDISPDDQRFLMVRAAGIGDEGPASALILVENWFEELKAKVGNR